MHSHLLSKLKDHFNWHTLQTHTYTYMQVHSFVCECTYVCMFVHHSMTFVRVCAVAFLLDRLFLTGQHTSNVGRKEVRKKGYGRQATEARETKIGSNKALKKQMHNRMQIICASVCAHCLNFNTIMQKCKDIFTYIHFIIIVHYYSLFFHLFMYLPSASDLNYANCEDKTRGICAVRHHLLTHAQTE